MSALPIDGDKTLSVSAYVSDRSTDPEQRAWSTPRWVVPGSTEQMLSAFEDFGEDAKKLLKVFIMILRECNILMVCYASVGQKGR
jgi:salicylate hydroxylase